MCGCAEICRKKDNNKWWKQGKKTRKKKQRQRENSTEGQLINCSLWGLLKTAGPSLVTLPSIISLKGRLLQARWLCPHFYMVMPIKSRDETVKKTERELSFRSYTNCEWYKRLASHFTARSSSTLAHNWKHSGRQYCLLNAMLLHTSLANVTPWKVPQTNTREHGHVTRGSICPPNPLHNSLWTGPHKCIIETHGCATGSARWAPLRARQR